VCSTGVLSIGTASTTVATLAAPSLLGAYNYPRSVSVHPVGRRR